MAQIVAYVCTTIKNSNSMTNFSNQTPVQAYASLYFAIGTVCNQENTREVVITTIQAMLKNERMPLMISFYQQMLKLAEFNNQPTK